MPARRLCIATLSSPPDHEPLEQYEQDELVEALNVAADHFHQVQADLLEHPERMSQMHRRESSVRHLLAQIDGRDWDDT